MELRGSDTRDKPSGEHPTLEATDPRLHWRRVVAILSGVAVFVAVFFLRREGVLDGIPALVFALLLASLLPWSGSLSRRILFAGALFLGWIPLLWWLKLPVPQVDRMGLVLAGVSAIIVGWISWGSNVRVRVKRLLPRLAPVDAMMLGALLLAAWTVWPLLDSSSGVGTLNVLMQQGFDHSGHSAMVIQARAQGAISPFLGAAVDGSAWIHAHYPQHFHGSIVALTELYSGSTVGGPAIEILRYGKSLALMQVVTAVLLTAGIGQLPNLRRRPLLAWPIAGMVVGAFIFGQGTWALSIGWENFIWACAVAGLAVLIAVSMSREIALPGVLALGGLVIATVHGWALLTPLTVVAVCVAFLPWRSSPLLTSRRNLTAAILVILATVAASAAVIPLLSEQGVEHILTVQADWIPSGISALSPLMLVVGMAIAAGLAAYVRSQGAEYKVRGIGLAAISTLGLLALIILGAYQLIKMGSLSYFFDKTVWGVNLISVVVLAAGLALHVDHLPHRRRPRLRAVAVVATIAATVASLQLFGWAGIDYRNWANEQMTDPLSAGRRVLEAANVAESQPFASTVYIAGMPGDPSPRLADAYVRGLVLMKSNTTYNRNTALRAVDFADGVDIDEATTAAQALLEQETDLTVVVAPELLDDIRARLPAELSDRVLTWESSMSD